MPHSAIAPLISGWTRRVGGRPGPYSVAPASGVSAGGWGINGLLVELLVDGSWVDITQRVMTRDGSQQISITRGQSAEGQAPTRGQCNFQLNNRDGLFSTANAMSPYWGKIGRNTQIRVSVAKGDDRSYRFWGEASGWPENWDLTGKDVWVDMQAVGILQRLGQGQTPLRSTLYRGLTSMATTPPVAYWPMEDGAASTSLASATGGPAMRIVGTPTLASDSGFLCSAALPVMAGGSFVGQIPAYTVTGKSQVRFLMQLPTEPPNGTQLVKCGATGTVAFWAVSFGTGGGLALRGLDTDGISVLFDTGFIAFASDGLRLRLSMELTQTGGNVAWALSVINATTGAITGASGTFNSVTVGRLTSVTVTPGQTITDGVFGHISVQNDVTNVSDLVNPVVAYVGENPSNRLTRLCAEQGINVARFGDDSLDKMGPQLPGVFLTLLQDCIDVDGGILMEREVAFGLAYKPRAFLYSQVSLLTLPYSGNVLSEVPTPVPDDQDTKNDITASRPNGSSATYPLDVGPLSTQDPPAGVGPYPDQVTLNVSSDDDLYQHAAWRVHLGTVNEPRYPSISVNLSRPQMAGSRLQALNLLPGARIVISGPPQRLGGDISQLVIGIQETITNFEHRLTYVCQPESPYRVAITDDPATARPDTGGSQLAADMGPTDATALLTVTGTTLWTTDPADYPINLTVGGEVVTARAPGAALDLIDGTFESGLTGWTPTSATFTPSADARTGSGSGLLTVTGSPTQAFVRPDTAHHVPATVGIEYRCSMWVKADTGWSAVAAIDWLDASHAFLSSTTSASVGLTVGAWTLLTVTGTAPASAAYLRAGPTLTVSPPTAMQLVVDDVATVATSTYLASPQSFTLIRSVNGVVKPHQVGEPVALSTPMLIAL